MQELRFAGHPTVGAAWVLLEEGRIGGNQKQFLLEEPVGAVPVRLDAENLIWLTTPPIRFGETYGPAACADALGLAAGDLLGPEPQAVSAGNHMIFIALRSRDAVDRASLEMHGYRQMKGAQSEPAGVFVFAPTPEGAYSRMFAPELGVVEDPATGSATGPLAAYMMRHGLAPQAPGTRWVSEQGTRMGRRSLLHVHIGAAGAIEVGGHVTPVAEGTMTL
jgi:trans-2,3-dihydro-3-hydroxyanthranilate isomerase